ncbi:hypothetical protein ACFFHM_10310 [Halalkalibacter kiskunsagensis]|uniref:Uncharacterized protein n=1 Tax=Halalkalibacter kiskunsagensis TaxID=1548599 RepID=A0ABV6KC31_9BACI
MTDRTPGDINQIERKAKAEDRQFKKAEKVVNDAIRDLDQHQQDISRNQN